MKKTRVKLKLWGVRGSIPTPGPDTIRYGGNTSCVEVWCGQDLLILDAGSGLRPLGLSLLARGKPINASVVLSHLHWDHIQGIPFFAPMFFEGNSVTFYGPVCPGGGLAENLIGQMRHPNFPVPLTSLKCDTSFEQIKVGESFCVGAINLQTAPLCHPGGAMGFRIEYNDVVVAYCCDHEHTPGEFDPEVLRLASNADVFIVDGTYTEKEFPEKRGWGHSTWQHACDLAEAAKVKRLLVSHHDPGHDDKFLDRVAASATRRFEPTWLAREGLEIVL